jgi:histidine triad (HIT) family protein
MPQTASNCLFCKVGKREVPADVVHESDRVVAFRDINPQAPTHILLIPKDHIESIADVGADQAKLLTEIVTSATHLARAEGLEGGWRLVTNVGPDAGQSVQHLHFHLLGGRRFRWPPG